MESSLSRVTSPDFRLFVLEQEFGQKRGGRLGSIADLGYIHQDWVKSGNLCVLTRTLSAEEKTKNRRPKSSDSQGENKNRKPKSSDALRPSNKFSRCTRGKNARYFLDLE